LLLEIVGKDFAVHKIDDDVVQRVRSLLARTPSNRHKIYPGLPLDKAIERAKADKKKLLSPVTQAGYLATFRKMLAVGVKKKFLLTNPADDVKPLKRDTVPADKKRLPLRPDQLKGFFEGEFYRSCSPAAEKPYSKPHRAWRFWMPLIMLFSGARPNEIAQLRICDLKRTDKGTLFLDLVNESEDEEGDEAKAHVKVLKTETSRRKIPLHSELVRLGFVQFVEARAAHEKNSAERLFSELKANKYGNYAWYVSRRFNEVFLPLEITQGREYGLRRFP
jgi:integrase